MFSGAPNAFGAAPNTQASGVDVALPGTLPVANGAAIEHAIRFGLAVKGKISPRSVFARKNYFYPDLPKGYQISQYEIPIVQGGTVRFFVDKEEKSIHLTRAHLEEDAGKSLHENFNDVTGIDLNRAGTPLLEIVTEPELRGAKEAIAYARALHALVVWIGICDGNMQEGSFRCDANVSVRKTGDEKLGTRCEIKNLNSFRFMEQAIEYEAKRQIGILEDGGSIAQQTRLYDADRNETRSMRSKEDAQDYRYFPDPDLLPLVISERDIENIRVQMLELPEAKRSRFIRDFGISDYEAGLLTLSKMTADYFEQATKFLLDKNPAKWSNTSSGPSDASKMYGSAIAKGMVGLLSAQLNRDGIEIQDSRVSSRQFAELHERHIDGTITAKGARDLFQSIWNSQTSASGSAVFSAMTAIGEGHTVTPKAGQMGVEGHAPQVSIDQLIDSMGLKQISDSGAIEKIIDEVLAANAKQVEDYRSGKEKAFNSLVGQVMKRSQGKANPAQVNEILRRKLSG
jgi:aspartyl-tRNA(Asn)/glutamyl-tRNA(Gln) amidotransferase subunit B